MEPKVSVIVPCYNSASTIVNTLNSLKKQTFKKFEIILINDGSTDDTEKIIKQFVNTNEDIKLKYYSQENKGVSMARNFAIQRAKGKYISFLDSDDIYHKDFLYIMVNEMEKYNNDVVITSYLKTSSPKKFFIDFPQIYSEKLKHDALLDYFMKRKMPIVFGCFLFKKEILDKKSIFFSENLRYGEDSELAWKYLSNCRTGSVVKNKLLYYFDDNPSSATNTVSWNMTDSIESVKLVTNYLMQNNDSFYNDYISYMNGRGIWTVAQKFSIAGNIELFNKLRNNYDVATAMKSIVNSNQPMIIKLTAIIYIISPKLFFYILFRYNKLKSQLRKS